MQITEQNILDVDISDKFIGNNTRIYKQAFQEYSEKEIQDMYEAYTGGTFDYSLKLTEGDIIKGKLIKQTDSDFLLDVGYKDYVRVENKKDEHKFLASYSDDQGYLEYGTEVDVLITKVSEQPFMVRGSVYALNKQISLTELIDGKDIPVKAYVRDSMPAGYNVDIIYNDFRTPAFMPNALAGANRLSKQEAEDLVGQTVDVMVESTSEQGIIASRKKFMKHLAKEKSKDIVNIDEKGEPVQFKGRITGSTKFGIFIEFNECLTGMIHIDNLTDEYKQKLKDRAIKDGSEMTFYVKEVINGKLILSQEWKETVWDTIKSGAEYTGTVKDIKSMGILVSLDDKTVGLIPNKNLSNKNIVIGEKIKVKVSNVIREHRKIYLVQNQ